VSQAIAKAGEPPQGVNVAVRGQVVPMAQIFSGLELGLLVAVLTIFLLLAGNFQSFRLSLAVTLTIPAVVAGVAVALRVTGTTLNIQSLMGAIMAIGVAVANAILLVTFAERDRVGGARVPDAAVAGAASRLRPILMTSCAMIAGMLPMALGLGEGGSQTAPLGRASDRRPDGRDHRHPDHPAGHFRHSPRRAHAKERFVAARRPGARDEIGAGRLKFASEEAEPAQGPRQG